MFQINGMMTLGAIHSTKISGNFGPKLNGSVRSNRKSFEKTGPPFEVVLFSRSDRSEFWLNGSRPLCPSEIKTRLNCHLLYGFGSGQSSSEHLLSMTRQKSHAFVSEKVGRYTGSKNKKH